MGNLVTVEAVDDNGNPVKSKRVKVVICKWDRPELTDYTDETGHVELETAKDYPDETQIEIQVAGEWFGPYYIGDGAFTVNIGGEEGEERSDYDDEEREEGEERQDGEEEKEAW